MSVQQNSGGSEEVALRKLDSLEKKIESMAKMKRSTTIATYIGLIIIIIFLAFFIFNIISFVRNYNTNKLANEMGNNMIELARSQEVKDIFLEINKTYTPALKKAVIAKMQKDTPMFKMEAQKMLASTVDYLQNKVKPELTENLIKNLAASETLMLQTYSNEKPSIERINTIIQNSNQYLKKNITKSIDNKLEQSLGTLSGLNNSFQELYKKSEDNSTILKGLTPDMVGEVQSRLIETLLEIIIYQMDPQKGNQPAFANGGAQ